MLPEGAQFPGLWRDLPLPPPGPLRAFLPPRAAHRNRILSWEDMIFALAIGDPQVVLLSGPAGCGKTTLLLTLARTLIDSESAESTYIRIAPGENPTPAEIWGLIRSRTRGATLKHLADPCDVRVLVDAEGLTHTQAQALAEGLDPPPGVAVWIVVRSPDVQGEWGQPAGRIVTAGGDVGGAAPAVGGKGAPAASAPGAGSPKAKAEGDRRAVERVAPWTWAPPSWYQISVLLRRRKQADLLAKLADGEGSWALRDPFLLGLLAWYHQRYFEVPSQPGPMLDALAVEIAGTRPGDRGRQVLVAELLPALAASLEAEGVEEWPEHRFRHLAFEVARLARLPLRPQDLAAAGVASEVLVRRGPYVAFCHPYVREIFAAWDLAGLVSRSGTAPLLGSGRHGPVTGGAPVGDAKAGSAGVPAGPGTGSLRSRAPTDSLPAAGPISHEVPAVQRISDGMASRLVAKLAKPERMQELHDLLGRQGRWAPLAQGLVESDLPLARQLRMKLLASCRALLAGGDDTRQALRHAKSAWYDEPLAALVALGGERAYEAVRDGLARSLATFGEGLADCGLGDATLAASQWTEAEETILENAPAQVLAYLDRERPYLRATARALRYLDGNRFVAEIAEGCLPPPVIRALLWDALIGDVEQILAGPAAQVGAALLDAHEARAWPSWILQTLPQPWGLAFLGSLGALAGPAGDPVAYLGWPPRRSEGFISVINSLWAQSLSAVEECHRNAATEALDRLLETFAATWDGAPEGMWDAIPGRPVARLAHFFLSVLHRHVGERESLRASRGLNAAFLACEPESLTWYLSRLREVIRVDRAGCLSPRQAMILGVALRFIQVRDRRLATLFGRSPSRATAVVGGSEQEADLGHAGIEAGATRDVG